MEAECIRRFKRVVLKNQENQGTCITLNRLIAEVQGEYVYLIASDDMAKTTALEQLQKNIEDAVLIVGNEEFVDAKGQQIGCDNSFSPQSLKKAKYKTFCDFYAGETEENYYQSKEFGSYKTLLVRNYIPNGYLVLASVLKNIIFTKEAPLEDWFMHLQLSKVGKYKFINEILFSYRLHGANAIKSKDHMLNMSRKTLNYEINLHKDDKNLNKLFGDVFQYKIYLNLVFVKFYRLKFLGIKKYCLDLFGKIF